jgi:hypothetical protein
VEQWCRIKIWVAGGDDPSYGGVKLINDEEIEESRKLESNGLLFINWKKVFVAAPQIRHT